MAIRLIYTIIWSALLLLASFPELFTRGLYFLSGGQVNGEEKNFTVILMMAVIIFLVDSVYNLIKTKNNFTPAILIGTALALFFIALFLQYGGGVCLFGCWGVLTSMKFLTTDSINQPLSTAFQIVPED